MTPWSRVAALALALVSPTAHAEEFAFERPCMGTVFRIVIHTDAPQSEAKAAAEAAFARAAELDACLSDYRADSEVGRFHRSPAGSPFPASETLRDVLKKAAAIQTASDGAFDPTRGALTRLWRMTRRTGSLPDPKALAAAKAASGLQQLEIDHEAKTLLRHSDLTRLDFGGIAKGYAADAMLAILTERKFPRSSIAASGDLRFGDAPPGKPGWTISIRPHGIDSPPATTLILANAAVSTSGAVEQAITIAGTTYSHIIDPATGLGMISPQAASAVAPTATQSDALATALTVLDPVLGMQVLKSCPDWEGAVFLPDSNQFSAGFQSSEKY